MTSWDERYRTGDYPTQPEPTPELRRFVDVFPDGRALDVATGSGRNALFLAEQGYDVHAVDSSEEGLAIARENAAERDLDVEFERADVTEYDFPDGAYDVVTVTYFRTLDALADLKAALAPDGVLFYQHHLRTTEPTDRGPSTDRYRFASNELLRGCLDLTVLHYAERTEVRDGRRSASVVLVARNSSGRAQSYPELG
jgi:SAM-dependent methyltransferase